MAEWDSYAVLTAPADGDTLLIRDVSDNGVIPAGQLKQVAVSDLAASLGAASSDDLAAETARAEAAEALLAPKASPALTGNPTAPTQTSGNNSTRIATTAFVADAVSGVSG